VAASVSPTRGPFKFWDNEQANKKAPDQPEAFSFCTGSNQ